MLAKIVVQQELRVSGRDVQVGYSRSDDIRGISVANTIIHWTIVENPTFGGVEGRLAAL